MKRVNYDAVAAGYDRRYARHSFEGVRRTLHRFVEGAAGAIVEVGCGTGHWLAALTACGFDRVFGADLSMVMLEKARAVTPKSRLVRAAAHQLPWIDGSLDRLFCVNALHHFENPRLFLRECRRVLRPGGGVLTIGLDPHDGEDRWWLYDIFPAALAADRQRYASAESIRNWLRDADFVAVSTETSEHIRQETPLETARREGLLERTSASQLMVITDDEFQNGMKHVNEKMPMLRADLRLYATAAWVAE